MASPTETLRSLSSARDIVLRDHALYPQVVPGVLQVIAPASHIELRRWGADFLAETFASQVVTAESKQHMSLGVLDSLRGFLSRKETMGEEEDISVVKSAVQCAASIYPFVFRHTVTTPRDSETWGKMAAIKSGILRRMDTAHPGVRICCIKFVACVVQTQTPGLIADPRRPEQNEISLALVPRDHAIITPANLEAEASGLLDRLLEVFQDDTSDPLIVTATLNSLATLVHRRASISNKILSAVLNFNPLKLANRSMSGREKVAVRSIARTTMCFLLNCLKRNPSTPFTSRLQAQVERLKHNLIEVFSENHQLKRPAPDEPIDGLDDAKRQRIESNAANGTTYLQQHSRRPLPAGPVSLAQLWTLTNDEQAATFHAGLLPPPVVTQLVLALSQSIPQAQIDDAINVVRSRWLTADKAGSTSNTSKALLGDDDDDDYDPSLPLEEGDVAVNGLHHGPVNGVSNGIAIGPFDLAPPPALTEADRGDYSKSALTRVFGTLGELDQESKTTGNKVTTEYGFNRLAMLSTSGHDREGWITLLTRLATRTRFDSEGTNGRVKIEDQQKAIVKSHPTFELSNGIREALLNYVMENFRSRIDVAIMWLNEEWYSDRLAWRQGRMQNGTADPSTNKATLPNYWHWTLRLLDAMMPYFDVKDGRILIRLLSEVPAINGEMLDRTRKIAEDPERIQISTNALLYLVMFRPPVRELAIDCAEQMWKDNRDARTATRKILSKWRPTALENEGSVEIKAEA